MSVIYSSLAQSVERMTVNHDVAGSSPAGGANKKTTDWWSFFVGSSLPVLADSVLTACREQGEPFSVRKSFLLGVSRVWHLVQVPK